ncbi:DUF6118 family protein [uncultured Sphingomonas sp.]|uniref:DUF6118 family protein n=1 Tax=uncultured Sphingomonas sp. TaxID=158754 RepID=UPI00262D8079|nr:DUF6118 family protein [uncultured Sphingomonas sp.]
MNDGDALGFALDPRDGQDAAAAAFDRLGRRMASLTAAVESFALRQEAIEARDTGPVIEKIDRRFSQVRDALLKLNARPGLQTTVEGIAASITEAGRTARIADHDALASAQRQIDASTRTLDRMIAGKIDLRKQCYWLAGAAGVCLLMGAIVGDAVLPMIDRAAPTSWRWPEERALDDLGMSANEAGQHLLQLSDPAGWHALIQDHLLVQGNEAAIDACRARRAKHGSPVDCSIVVSGPKA